MRPSVAFFTVLGNDAFGGTHMDRNLDDLERLARFLLGAVLLANALHHEGSEAWWGLFGVLPLLTAMAGRCPLVAYFSPARSGS
jgi:Protein of unknown function (DUF2892)